MEVLTEKQTNTLVRREVQKAERQIMLELTSWFEKQLSDLRFRLEAIEREVERNKPPLTAPSVSDGEFVETLLDVLDGLGRKPAQE